MKIFGIDGWGDYTDVDKKINAGRGRWSAPAAPAPDRPEDKLASQAKFTDAMRADTGPATSFMLGMRSAVDQGPVTGGLMNWLAGNKTVPEEAQRKMNYAAAELNPLSHFAGQAVGAVPAAVDWGITGVGALAGGMKALAFGSKAPAAVPRAAGAVGQWTSGLTTPGKASYLARFVNSNPIAASLGTLVTGAGAGSVIADTTNGLVPAEAPPITAPAGPLILDRDAAASGGMSPSQQYLRQIHKPDGSRIDGITAGEADLARIAAEVEYNNNRPGSGRIGMVAAPVGMTAGPNGGAVYVQGGEARQAAWQNQYGTSKGLSPADMTPIPADANAPTLASAVNAPAGVEAAAPAGTQYGALAAEMDAYEAAHPGNKNGTVTTEEYKAAKAAAAEDRLNMKAIRLGKLIGIDDPDTAVEFGRAGGFTQALMREAITGQQGRSTQKLGYRDLAWMQADQDLRVAEAEAKRTLTGDELKAALTTIDTRRQKLLSQSLAPNTLLPTLQDGADVPTGN